MMLWDSPSIVRLRTQVTQSLPRPLAERACVLGRRTLKYFLQRLCCHGNLWKNTGSILSIFSRLCHHWNSWDWSQVPCRRWWAISLIPRSCVHPRSLPGNLRPEDSVPASAGFSRSVNCPSRRVFHLRHALVSLASRPFRFPHGVLIDCWPSESPFMDATADQNETQRKLDRRLKSISLTIEISILCIVVGIWASYTIFTLYCYLNYKPMLPEGTHLTGLNPSQIIVRRNALEMVPSRIANL